jgi:hypothetical protein
VALTLSGLAAERSGEFLAGGELVLVDLLVVYLLIFDLLIIGGGFGIGQHFAGTVDDGGARAGRLAFLGGNIGERMGSIGLDAMGEEQSFLGEVALDFGAQRGFPCAADHEVERDGRGGDHDEKSSEEFEKDAAFHRSSFPSILAFHEG